MVTSNGGYHGGSPPCIGVVDQLFFFDSVGLVDQLGAFDLLQDNDLYHSGFVNRHGNLHHYSGVHHLDVVDHHGNLHDFGVVHQIVAVDPLGVVDQIVDRVGVVDHHHYDDLYQHA